MQEIELSTRPTRSSSKNPEQIHDLNIKDDSDSHVNNILDPYTASARVEEASLSNVESESTTRRNESSLAPVDSGFGAWSFLAAAFLVEAIVWGFPNAFGVFLDAYLRDVSLTSQPRASSLLPLVGPLSTGIIYCAGPLLHPVLTRYPSHRRTAMWIGLLLCFCSLLGASYTNNVSTLIVLQGGLYGIGGVLLYHPCISYMSEWFVKRRGLANGIIFAGTAAGGLILPLFLPSLIAKFGTSKTLRYVSIGELLLLVPTIPFVKPRLPESNIGFFARRGDRMPPRNWSWLKESSVWFLLGANTLQGFAYFLPLVWLPTFASALPYQNGSSSSLALALLNGSSLLGRISMGILSDKLNPFILAISTLTFTSLATFILWGVLASSFKGVLAFGIVYGCFASGWSSLYTGFIRRFAKDDPTISTSIIGVLMFTRGIGNILSTPISTALQHNSSSFSNPSDNSHFSSGFNVSGGQYSDIIIFVGTCFAGSALVATFGWGWDVWRISTGRERRVVERPQYS